MKVRQAIMYTTERAALLKLINLLYRLKIGVNHSVNSIEYVDRMLTTGVVKR